MRTITTRRGHAVEIDSADPSILDILDAIRRELLATGPEYETEDAVVEIRQIAEQMSLEESRAFLREFMHFAWLRYDEDMREIERKMSQVRRAE
jgi:hypothetical protein